jgi:hypothetical protein
MTTAVVKASLFWLVGFAVFTCVWYWYYLRPSSNKAIGAGAMRAVFSSNPIYWSMAFTAAFAYSSLYLYLKFRRP